MQTTSHIMMIRPVNFSFNAETAVNNAFQVPGKADEAQENARREFDQFVEKLIRHKIDVTVINDTPLPYTPDSIFPNNWVSFHEDGRVVLYPMFAPNRRAERKQSVLDQIFSKFSHTELLDLSNAEKENRFLEGTGSMVLDRTNKIVYACLSPRTDKALTTDFANKMGYKAVCFYAYDQSGREIYHTNVMMCIADKYAVVCLNSITSSEERQHLIDTIEHTGKTIIEISPDQMNAFAGNMLQVKNTDEIPFVVMSSQAFHSLSQKQLKQLEAFNQIIHADLQTIETNGGGSARCMMAEIFLPPLVL
jgi:hypothetical protein